MDKTRYFLDTEFIEDGKTIDLISIGIVCEDGREFYAINHDCDFSKANQWVKDNVLIHIFNNPSDPLPLTNDYIGGWRNKLLITHQIKQFITGTPEFWGYYADYDWVVFCQLFGPMMDLPRRFPMYCNDLKQLCNELGNPQLPDQENTEHHALNDARWNKKAFDFLRNLEHNVAWGLTHDG